MDKKYCLGLYEKAMPGNLTMAEKLTAAREAGYDYLEMSVDETDEKLARLNMSREERKTVLTVPKDGGDGRRDGKEDGTRKRKRNMKQQGTVRQKRAPAGYTFSHK